MSYLPLESPGRLAKAAALFTLAVLAVLGVLQRTSAQTMSADERAIRAILENHQRWYNAGDWKSIRSEFADEIVVMPDFTTTIVGPDHVEQLFRENFQALAEAGATQTMDAHLDEVQVFGDWAFDRGSFDITTRKGEKNRTFHIRFVELFKKQADGSWKIVRGMNNYTEPPFPPSPPADQKPPK